MNELLKTNGEKLRPFSESSRLYTVREKKNDPYIDPFIDSDLSFPDPPNQSRIERSSTADEDDDCFFPCPGFGSVVTVTCEAQLLSGLPLQHSPRLAGGCQFQVNH